MAQRDQPYRTPVRLIPPAFLHSAPGCTPAPVPHAMRGWRSDEQPLTGTREQVDADLDLAFAALVSR